MCIRDSLDPWVFATLVTRFGPLCPSCTVQHTLRTPLVFFTLSSRFRGSRGSLHSTNTSPLDPSPTLQCLLQDICARATPPRTCASRCPRGSQAGMRRCLRWSTPAR
eukprot:6773092-Pyramimonas_sp.AAC.1